MCLERTKFLICVYPQRPSICLLCTTQPHNLQHIYCLTLMSTTRRVPTNKRPFQHCFPFIRPPGALGPFLGGIAEQLSKTKQKEQPEGRNWAHLPLSRQRPQAPSPRGPAAVAQLRQAGWARQPGSAGPGGLAQQNAGLARAVSVAAWQWQWQWQWQVETEQ